ncbi:MAG: EamA/RhaT family transporter, partial [Candidatus Rokuibacteriota bacterium]
MAGDSSTLGSVALGLASAASWGAGDFAGGLASRRAPALGVVVVSQTLGIALLSALALLVRESPPAVGQLAWAALAGAAGAMG